MLPPTSSNVTELSGANRSRKFGVLGFQFVIRRMVCK